MPNISLAIRQVVPICEIPKSIANWRKLINVRAKILSGNYEREEKPKALNFPFDVNAYFIRLCAYKSNTLLTPLLTFCVQGMKTSGCTKVRVSTGFTRKLEFIDFQL